MIPKASHALDMRECIPHRCQLASESRAQPFNVINPTAGMSGQRRLQWSRIGGVVLLHKSTTMIAIQPLNDTGPIHSNGHSGIHGITWIGPFSSRKSVEISARKGFTNSASSVSIQDMEGKTIEQLWNEGQLVGSWKTKRGAVEIYDIGCATSNGFIRTFAVDHTKTDYPIAYRPTVVRYLQWSTVLYAWDGESAHRA